MVDRLLVLFCDNVGYANFESFGRRFSFLSRGVQTFDEVPNGLRESVFEPTNDQVKTTNPWTNESSKT